MALATQCPHCFTIFRVASDQLKLRGGLVRCGACREVFNGGEYLVEASIADGQYHAVPGSKAQIAPPETRQQIQPPAFAASAPPEPATQIAPNTLTAAPSIPAAPPRADDVPLANTPLAAAPSPIASPTPPAQAPIVAPPEPRVFRSPGHPDYIPDLSSPLKAGAASFDTDKDELPNLLRARALDDNQPAAGLPITGQPAAPLSPLPMTPSNATAPDIGAAAAPPVAPLTEGSTPLLRARSADTTSSQPVDILAARSEDIIGEQRNDRPAHDAFSSGKREPLLAPAEEERDSFAESGDIKPAADDHAEEGATTTTAASNTEQEDASADDEAEEEFDEDDEPAFVKKAERRERLGGILRMTMFLLAAAMIPVILLQSMYYWRNQIAATVPAIKPMLNGMCATFHCTVGLPAEIDQLSLESNELQVVPPSQNIYALSVVIRNRSTEAQAWPHIELTLNNDDEKPVVRRVFRPQEYLASPQVIDNGVSGSGEQQIKLTFELKDALVSGYRIYLFYP